MAIPLEIRVIYMNADGSAPLPGTNPQPHADGRPDMLWCGNKPTATLGKVRQWAMGELHLPADAHVELFGEVNKLQNEELVVDAIKKQLLLLGDRDVEDPCYVLYAYVYPPKIPGENPDALNSAAGKAASNVGPLGMHNGPLLQAAAAADERSMSPERKKACRGIPVTKPPSPKKAAPLASSAVGNMQPEKPTALSSATGSVSSGNVAAASFPLKNPLPSLGNSDPPGKVAGTVQPAKPTLPIAALGTAASGSVAVSLPSKNPLPPLGHTVSSGKVAAGTVQLGKPALPPIAALGTAASGNVAAGLPKKPPPPSANSVSSGKVAAVNLQPAKPTLPVAALGTTASGNVAGGLLSKKPPPPLVNSVSSAKVAASAVQPGKPTLPPVAAPGTTATGKGTVAGLPSKKSLPPHGNSASTGEVAAGTVQLEKPALPPIAAPGTAASGNAATGNLPPKKRTLPPPVIIDAVPFGNVAGAGTQPKKSSASVHAAASISTAGNVPARAEEPTLEVPPIPSSRGVAWGPTTIGNPPPASNAADFLKNVLRSIGSDTTSIQSVEVTITVADGRKVKVSGFM
ncbi:uncharacterized protein LOC129598838 [Paramacrobiotus metropolitanus]|uniref:uncharacterized protein LOC129598838 n=1 Tax=Paramacrobiotus metropolitanus TaxID=2943436 RepID=UPI002445D3A4|nr:uncharacterized protein LOC129598838 [Paramacrobiotus metropolitanus]